MKRVSYFDVVYCALKVKIMAKIITNCVLIITFLNFLPKLNKNKRNSKNIILAKLHFEDYYTNRVFIITAKKITEKQMNIKLLLFIFFVTAVQYGQDILRVHTPDGSFQDYEINNISKLIFTDHSGEESVKIYDPDGEITGINTGNIDRLIFSDWYGYLAAPLNLTVLADSTVVTLDWDAVESADDYLIFRSETDPYSGFVKIDSTAADSYIDNDLLPGNKYFYHIVARNGLLIKH